MLSSLENLAAYFAPYMGAELSGKIRLIGVVDTMAIYVIMTI